jgi:hypothetical protein
VQRKRFMLKLPEVQQRLHALLKSEGSRVDGTSATPAAQLGVHLQANVAGTVPIAPAAHGSYPSPLSRQVKALRSAADGPLQSVQRNVSEAFQSFIRRLDALYQSVPAPSDFKERLDHWRASCGLPADVHTAMHVLRIWRNASEHQDEGRWAREGPSDAAAASQHIAALDVRLRELEHALV